MPANSESPQATQGSTPSRILNNIARIATTDATAEPTEQEVEVAGYDQHHGADGRQSTIDDCRASSALEIALGQKDADLVSTWKTIQTSAETYGAGCSYEDSL